jgi:Tfp pilus assembly protein PilO
MTPTRRIFEEKRRYIYPIVGALLLNIVLLAVVVYPLSKKVENGEQAAQQAQLAHAAANKDFQAARATVSGKASADGELKKFYSAVLPTDMSQARRTMFKVSELARNANLNRGRGAQKESHERDSALGKLTNDLTLTGQYPDIRQFIYDLETSPEFLVIEHVGLSSQGTDGGGALRLDVRVATYYRAGSNGH